MRAPNAMRRRRGRVHVPRDLWSGRLDALLRALDAPPADLPLERRVEALLVDATDAQVWLALAVLSGRLPTPPEVRAARREAQLDGPACVIAAARRLVTPDSAERVVEVVLDGTLVDMGDLVLYPLGTGIQRVAREVGRAWRERPGVAAIGWTTDMDGLVPLTAAERDRALSGSAARPEGHRPTKDSTRRQHVVVPWGGAYVLPELAIQPRRCASLQALATFAPVRTSVVGFDCVPLTSAETSAAGFPAVFALNLAAVAQFHRVVAISEAAAIEYRGWRRMLGGAGLAGPDIVALSLPEHAPDVTPAEVEAARQRFVVGGQPFVLCVGSNEPRKNHVAVLHAAERLWRQGRRFSLTFVGGNSWNSDAFLQLVAEAQGAGRPVDVATRLDDRMLWAAYRVARCTVFPSLNEGFGLPVAESLAAGTPAITSSFGSMAEIAAGGGALLIDPRSSDDLTSALGRLLTDDELHAELTAAAHGRQLNDWPEYAAHLWDLTHEERG